MEPVRVGVVGTGNISGIYLENSHKFPEYEVVAVADIVQERAQAQADKYSIPKAVTPDDLIADPDVELVLNLTIPAAHTFDRPDPRLQLLGVHTLHLFEADVTGVLGHACRCTHELILWPLLGLCRGHGVGGCCSGRRWVELFVSDPVHLVNIPIPVMSSVRIRVGDALVHAEVPVEMTALLLASFVCGKKTPSPSTALIRLRIVKSVH